MVCSIPLDILSYSDTLTEETSATNVHHKLKLTLSNGTGCTYDLQGLEGSYAIFTFDQSKNMSMYAVLNSYTSFDTAE